MSFLRRRQEETDALVARVQDILLDSPEVRAARFAALESAYLQREEIERQQGLSFDELLAEAKAPPRPWPSWGS